MNALALPGRPEAHVYKRVGGHELSLHLYRPDGEERGQPRPAILFFFGGGWRMGTVRQFVPHARYFCSRGLASAVVDYRVASRHGCTPFDCVADAKSAIRWLGGDADRFGIDPERIVASGGSAGGHLAACAALIDGFDEPGEDPSVGARPAALVLFNPVLDLVDFARRRPDLAVAGDYLEISPMQHVGPGGPPAVVFHGKDDVTVAFEATSRFCRAYSNAGNTCALHAYPGRTHGFFNLSRSREDFVDTVRLADEFLAGLGLLEGRPDLDLLRGISPAV